MLEWQQKKEMTIFRLAYLESGVRVWCVMPWDSQILHADLLFRFSSISEQLRNYFYGFPNSAKKGA